MSKCTIITIILFTMIFIIINWSVIDDNVIIDMIHVINTQSNTKHVFWTGGYDSTFRICTLIKQGIHVQPIYIFSADGKTFNNISIKRKNVHMEIKTMNKIRNMINHKYPQYMNNLYPTIYVKNMVIDPNIRKASCNIYYSRFGLLAPILNGLFGYFSRPINQYEMMAQFTKNYKYNVDVCVLDSEHGFTKMTRQYIIGEGDSHRIRKHGNHVIYQKFRLPLVHMNKEEMKHIAINEDFIDILKITWSWWYPINDKPYQKCEMCKYRVLS